MHYGVYIALMVAVLLVVLALTGWWRWALAPFRIRPSVMTVERCGLLVSSAESVQRVNTLLQSFAGGFNAMISQPSSTAWERYCSGLPPLYRPFAQEGAAMGFTLRRLFRYDPEVFESRIVRPHDGFRYLHYVGLGFWSGMRKHGPEHLDRIIEGLDPLHGYLCYDGYGFKHGFFDYAKEPAALAPLNRLQGYARRTAYQGVGRAFFFLYMEHPDLLVEHIRRLGPYAKDVAGGVGLASVFVDPDRLELATNLAAALPPEWHPHVHLGMCFGLKARSINDPDQFDRDLSRLEPSLRQAIEASIEACDRMEAQVRSEGGEDGYQRWRELVTEWMLEHIDYPLAGVKPKAERVYEMVFTLSGEPKEAEV